MKGGGGRDTVQYMDKIAQKRGNQRQNEESIYSICEQQVKGKILHTSLCLLTKDADYLSPKLVCGRKDYFFRSWPTNNMDFFHTHFYDRSTIFDWWKLSVQLLL